jgi:hypothetical protein
MEVAAELAGLAAVDEDDGSLPAEEGARLFGHSKDHRDGLPQVVIAMAVTRDGIPVRCWTFPGSTGDQKIIRRVKGGWNLRRLVWVADRGFASAANRACLSRGGGHYIHAEKLRTTNSEAAQALARPGRYRPAAGNLRLKEVAVGADGERAARSPSATTPARPSGTSWSAARLAAHLEGLISGSDAWAQRRRDELAGSLRDKPGQRRFLRRTPGGLLRTGKAAIAGEAHLDGKWLLRTNDDTLTPEDLAAACKQLLEAERGWRDMKGALGLRPVCHHRADRIRAHVQLCRLALLLIRVIQAAARDTWRNIRCELGRMHLVTLAAADGQIAQRPVTTPGQQAIFSALKLPAPPLFFDFTIDAGTGR